MQILKANTAVDVLIGPFVDDTDGKTAETGLTISQADILLSKNGQALTQKTDATAAAHDSDGYYNCELDATDTNTEGTMVLIVNESGALPVRHEFMVMAEAAYDSLFAAKDTGYMDVNVKAISEDTTAADNLESACDNYSVTRGLTGTALPAAAADAAGGIVISDAGGQDFDTMLSNIAAILADTGTTLDGKIDTIAGYLDTEITAIKAVTDALTAAAAAKLALSAGTIVSGTVSHDVAAATTTVFRSDDITEATADHFNGRIVIFTSGDLQYQATDITDYELASAEGKFTVTALTEAPADNVTFIII